MTPESVDRRISRVAARQHGVFTREDAHEAGADDALISRRLAQRLWIRMHRGVYRLAGAPRTWLQSLLAAVLHGGPGSLASHQAAGALHELPDFPSSALEISVGRSRRIRIPGIIVHQSRGLIAADRVIIQGIPTTSATRTLIDLAGSIHEETLEELLDDLLRRGRTTLPRIRRRLEQLRGSGRKGLGVLAKLCDARDDGMPVPETILETRTLRVIRRGGLPLPVRQYPVTIGGKDYRFDFAYPDCMLAIEADGYGSRASRLRWEGELTRQNAVVIAGWTVLRFTKTDVEERPDYVVASIAEELRKRRSA